MEAVPTATAGSAEGAMAELGGGEAPPVPGRPLARVLPQGENGVGGGAVRVGTRRSQVGSGGVPSLAPAVHRVPVPVWRLPG